MSDACECIKDPPVKSKWNKKFPFAKKKKKKKGGAEVGRSIPEEAIDCPLCAQMKNSTVPEHCMVDVYEEKKRVRTEVARQNLAIPTVAVDNPADLGRPNCDCTKCRRARGEDPLTVELLPMETQITLQGSLQDTILMCTIL